ncbi:hypothetical protein GPECTOR_5g448 [Gonium pectorale]|uniref:Sucrose phosphatase-like domain-containing protein n=1 Tax=Gonium pectorale TaxID=33097 RepID=A0A150GXF5_GONPE|nr:hypothetical protein GPECTOR_5g448 [Gonium pectorale]|eukprot:KXZ54368.1 hypothetical protein GPECTOR_5g448 [Gonium pectorale]
MAGLRGREWDSSCRALRQLWEASGAVRPGLLVLATSRLMPSLQQAWWAKQDALPQPDVLLLGLGTAIAYRVPPQPEAGEADADAHGGRSRGSGGWRLDAEWAALMDASYDADAVRRAVDSVLQMYGHVRIAPQRAAAPGSAALELPAGRPAVSYGLAKQQSRHKVSLLVHRSLRERVVTDLTDALRATTAAHSTRPDGGTRQHGCGGHGGPVVVAGVRLVTMPRGPRGEWFSVDVIPAAAGKAAALCHVLRRFRIPPAAVVAAGDTDRDAELLAAAGAAVITTPRPPPTLRRLLEARAAAAEGLDPWASAASSAASGIGGYWAGGAGGVGERPVVQSSSFGPAGVLEGLQRLGLV